MHEANNAFEAKKKEKVDMEVGRVRDLTTGKYMILCDFLSTSQIKC